MLFTYLKQPYKQHISPFPVIKILPPLSDNVNLLLVYVNYKQTFCVFIFNLSEFNKKEDCGYSLLE